MDNHRKKQILGILILAFSLMFFISLVDHNISDDIQITSDEAVYGNPFTIQYDNLGGMMGAYFSYVAFFFLGWSAFLLVIYLAVLSLKIIGLDLGQRLYKHASMWWLIGVLLLSLKDISTVASDRHFIMDIPYGVGVLGQSLVEIVIKLIGVPGAYLLYLAFLVSALVYYFSISHRFRNAVNSGADLFKEYWGNSFEKNKAAF